MMTVYVAAPKACLRRARRFAALARAIPGARVVSTWHETMPPGAVDPVDPWDGFRILATNLSDLYRSSCVVGLLSAGVGLETYVELGRAIELGKAVILSAERGGLPLSRHDSSVTVVDTDAEALAMLASWAR